jgi:deoxycytidylate deaminase
MNNLEPYFRIAEAAALNSECIRRQYGAVVVRAGADFAYSIGYNKRVTRCCDGKYCARDRHHIAHGQRTEVGGEIHAEQAVLISAGMRTEDSYFILAGFDKRGQLYGKDTWPCHACAMSIRYAGYTHIYIKENKEQIVPVSIARILEGRENEWEPEG